MGNLDQVVLFQRPTGLHDIHDHLGQSDHRRQFNRTVQLDDLHLDSMVEKKLFGHPRKLRRHPHVRVIAKFFPLQRRRNRQHQPAQAEIKIKQFVNIAGFFQQHILADNPDICRAILDIGRQIHRFGNDELNFFRLIGNHQFPRILRQPFRRITETGQ